MAIDFAARIAASNRNNGSSSTTTQNSEKPKAKFWANIGYYAGVGEHRKFVSTPLGLALDTQEHIKTGGQNSDFNNFTGARNDLLDRILEAAEKLAPGEEDILNLDIQIRRVNESVKPASGEDNDYSLVKAGVSNFNMLIGNKKVD